MNMSAAASTPPRAIAQTDSPIFVTGFARSGTTWVNTLFRDYLDAGFVNEGQFILSMGLHLSRYGDLNLARNHQRLLRNLRADPFFPILQRNYSVDIDWHRVARTGPTFAAIVMDILQQVAEQTGKRRIGSKNPQFGRHLDWLNATFPTCRVVHVIRDGRDCALSHKNMVWGRQNTYAAARLWRQYLHRTRAAARRMSARYLEIRYEDLLAKPELSMAALEAFVAGASGPATERFVIDAKLLKTDKIEGWRRKMTPAAQAIFEGVAGDALHEAGYPLTGIAHRPSACMRGVYAAHDKLSRETWHWARKVVPSIPEHK
ncbi:MAG TPA: sulfotransferase [Oleiagrimonas sp.]|nr:sulfotransferase [Oleiagrimonas sp.]